MLKIYTCTESGGGGVRFKDITPQNNITKPCFLASQAVKMKRNCKLVLSLQEEWGEKKRDERMFYI